MNPESFFKIGPASQHAYSDALSVAFKKAGWKWASGYPTPDQINTCIAEIWVSSNKKRDNAPVGVRVTCGGLAVENDLLHCHPRIAKALGTANTTSAEATQHAGGKA